MVRSAVPTSRPQDADLLVFQDGKQAGFIVRMVSNDYIAQLNFDYERFKRLRDNVNRVLNEFEENLR